MTADTALTEEDRLTEYLDGYEWRGDDGDYTPNEHERLLIEDALRGWISEEHLIAQARARIDREGVARIIDPVAFQRRDIGRDRVEAERERGEIDSRQLANALTDLNGLTKPALAKADAIIAMLGAGIPEGYMLVPIEPTEAMVRAIRTAYFGSNDDNWPVKAYHAMLAASKGDA